MSSGQAGEGGGSSRGLQKRQGRRDASDSRISSRSKPATGNGQTEQSNSSAVQELAASCRALHRLLRKCGTSTEKARANPDSGVWSGAGFLFIALLLTGPQDVKTLAHSAGIEMSKASRYLASMREDGILSCRQVGGRKVHSLGPRLEAQRAGAEWHVHIRESTGTGVMVSFPAGLIERAKSEMPAQVHGPETGPSIQVRAAELQALTALRIRRPSDA